MEYLHKYNTHEIWPGIYSSHQRCRDAIIRLGLTLTEDKFISQNDYAALLNYRLTTATDKVKPEVLQRLATIGIPSPTLNANEQLSISSPPGPPAMPLFIRSVEWTAQWATSKAAIFLTLLGALSIQIHHLALIVYKVSPQDSLILAYIFGFVSEITALMLTVHQAKKHTLILFAFLQCWINILYYCELPSIVIRLTLSGLIAFVIYSYSELFTSLRSTEQNTSVFHG